MKSAMAMLCHNFSVTKSADAKPVEEHFGFLMAPKNLSVDFRKRARGSFQAEEHGSQVVATCPFAAVGS
jgi:hypothetical protein